MGPEAEIDDYESLRDYITQVEDELGFQNKVNLLPSSGGTGRIMDVLTEAISSLPDDVIVVTSTLTTDFSAEFMSRALTNTIQGKQVFAPIAFWEYAPNLIYDKSRPERVEVSRNVGHFGEQWYDHLAFFSDDFKAGIAGKEDAFAEPIDVFTYMIGMKILRAPEPQLLVRNYSPACLAKIIGDRPKCSMQFLDNIGSGPILARSLLRNGFINTLSQK